MTVVPYTPNHFLDLAKQQISVGDKITTLRRLVKAFPLDHSARIAKEQLVQLLTATNRYDKALQEYQHAVGDDPGDFRLLECLLKAGRHSDVLRQTPETPRDGDFIREEKLMEYRVQAFLAKGEYRAARLYVEAWLDLYKAPAAPGEHFEDTIRSIRYLRRHLAFLERRQGPAGKPLFTASVPDSLKHWSQRQDVPIVFFKMFRRIGRTTDQHVAGTARR